jgi:tetratricopeptide (TPR) repeat protein
MRIRRTMLVPAIVLAALLPARAAAQAAPATLVMPFDNPLVDPRLNWLAEGSALLLSDYLERYGASTITRDERVSAFERLQLPPAAALSHATVIKVGQFVGAADVVIGAYELAGDHLTVRARVIRLDAGRMTPEVVERGPLGELFGIFDRTARRLRGATMAAPPPASGTLLSSLPAFELYAKGLAAETPSTQRQFLEQAVKAAPGDDRVRLALWRVHTDAGDHLRALDAVKAVPASSLHARTARYFAALSQIDLKRYEEAFDTLRTLQNEGPSAEVLNAIGVVQLRRGSTPQTGRPVYYFSQASQTDPSDPDYFFNLGYAYWIDKDPPAAVYWLREAVRRDPADGDAHYVLGAALHQTGATAEAQRELELARRLSSSYEEQAKSGAAAVPRGLERLKEHLYRRTRVDSILTSAGQRDQSDLATFHLEAGRRAFAREADREAESELRRALYLSPYLAEAHLLLGRIHMRSGRTSEAIQAFKIALWSEATVEGHVALAEAYLNAQNIAAAKEEVDRALALDPKHAGAQALRAKIGR